LYQEKQKKREWKEIKGQGKKEEKKRRKTVFKGPHVTTKVPDLVVLGMRKQVKNLKKAEKI
jgi:hypothetical protein